MSKRIAGLAADGSVVLCTHDRYDGTASCARCLEVLG